MYVLSRLLLSMRTRSAWTECMDGAQIGTTRVCMSIIIQTVSIHWLHFGVTKRAQCLNAMNKRKGEKLTLIINQTMWCCLICIPTIRILIGNVITTIADTDASSGHYQVTHDSSLGVVLFPRFFGNYPSPIDCTSLYLFPSFFFAHSISIGVCFQMKIV